MCAKQAIDADKIRELQYKLLDIIIDFDMFCRKYGIEYYLASGSVLGAIRHKGFIPWDDDLDVFMTYENYQKFLQLAERELDNTKYFVQKEDTKGWPMFFSKVRMNGTTYLEYNWEYSKSNHNGIFIDVFCLNRAPDNQLMRYIQFFAAKVLVAKGLIDRGGYSTNDILKKAVMLFARSVMHGCIKKMALNWVRKYEGKDSSHVCHLFAATNFRHAFFPASYLGNPRYVPFEGVELPVPQYAEKYLEDTFGDYMVMPKIEDRCSSQHAEHLDLCVDYSEYKERLVKS